MWNKIYGLPDNFSEIIFYSYFHYGEITLNFINSFKKFKSSFDVYRIHVRGVIKKFVDCLYKIKTP